MDKRDMNRALEYARLIKEFVCGQFPEEFTKYNKTQEIKKIPPLE